jgi:acyl transferase domain-containing protein
MLSVRGAANEVQRLLPAGVTVAAENSPRLCVVAGPIAAVADAQRLLEDAGLKCQSLVTSHAFHSAMMDPVIAPFRAAVARVRLAAPNIPFVSTATGTWITPSEALDPDYWSRHLRAPVRFATAVRTLLDQPDLALLEVGPRGTLTTLVRQQLEDKDTTVAVPSLGNDDATSWITLLAAAGRLYLRAVSLLPGPLHGDGRRRVPLPSYPFDARRFWVDPPVGGAPEAGTGSALGALLVEQARVMKEQLEFLASGLPDGPMKSLERGGLIEPVP